MYSPSLSGDVRLTSRHFFGTFIVVAFSKFDSSTKRL